MRDDICIADEFNAYHTFFVTKKLLSNINRLCNICNYVAEFYI